MDKNNGGPAFPLSHSHIDLSDTNWESTNGMMLRDYFAAKALSGIANQRMLENAMTEEQCELEIINAAALAYRLADAMLGVRDGNAMGMANEAVARHPRES